MRDLKIYFHDILDSINLIEKYISGKKEQDFIDDIQLQDSVIRRLEIIGEAVKHIPESIRNQNLSIPWRQIAGLRDMLIHEYFGIKMSRVWKILIENLSELKNTIICLIVEKNDEDRY
ncbi:MAG TPA: hypothetical protein DHW82_04100 [Spirochaetia bacterium]|nr:MAG: hypothetical protein A2Y41_11220 [Spirochaetes bacterium GWB1_36_13]HCL56175.1 hypothetical protein [Spirochaetia bacterium]